MEKKTNGLGPKRIENKYEKEYKNTPVRISCGNQTAGGILQKVEGYTFYLENAVIYQNTAKEKVGEWDYKPKMQKDKLTMIEVCPPFLIEPLDEGYLEEFVKSYDLWKIKVEDKK